MTWDEERFDRRENAVPGYGIAILVLGAAVGALATLFLAPKSGKQMQSFVTDTAGTWKEQVAEKLFQGKERLVNAVEHTQSET